MKAQAILYTSNTGFTKQYAEILSKKIDLPVYSLKEAQYKLEKAVSVIYLGWVFANTVKGYKKAAKKYKIIAVCAVGLSESGSVDEEIRKTNSLSVPLFSLQGGLDKQKLRGIHKFMIGMLIKGLSSQAERSEKDEKMLALLKKDGSYVNEESLSDFIKWYFDKLETGCNF